MPSTQQRQPPAYRLLAGDELGVLRAVEVPAGPKWSEAALAQKWGEADKNKAITCICCTHGSTHSGTREQAQICCVPPASAAPIVAVGRKGRRVDILDAATGASQATMTVAASSSSRTSANQVHIAAVAFVGPAETRPLQLVAAASDGVVSISSCNSNSSSDAGANGSQPEASASGWNVNRYFQAGSNITCMAVDSNGHYAIIGSKGCQPSIWDLSTGTKLWQAKGGKPNRVRLVDKPFTTALALLSVSNSSCSGNQDNRQQVAAAAPAGDGDSDGGEQDAKLAVRFIAGSVFGKLHVYDTAAGRRPQSEVIFGATRVTALAPQGQSQVWAANGTGHIQLLDLSMSKLQGAVKGAGGSIRALTVHPDGEPLIASAGLDRFLRVHDANSRVSCGRVYLKQQLTAVCWLPAGQQGNEAAPAAGPAGAGAPVASKQQPEAAVDGTQAAAAIQATEQQQRGRKGKRKGSKASKEQAADPAIAAAAATEKRQKTT
eukprot:GHRR01008158.1.p1 GENE.GHRR01008158.1~~GHRR01008158.1.p1  ORF type:complete len:490 (+),score=230.32 GHRR01008158.1:252-1721(+)